MQDHLGEVEDRLAQAAAGIPRAKAEERRRFMKAPMAMLGLAVPAQRKIARTGFGFSALPPGDQLAIWDHIWRHARTHEAKMQPLYYLEGKAVRALAPARLWAATRPWADSLNCWDQSDGLSKIYATLLEADPDLVYPTLEAWNGGADPWKRRQSVVSLIYYAASRRRAPALARILPLVTALLGDEAYYVQKGVGWTLRECFNLYPDDTLDFLRQRAGEIDPRAFSAATEKLSPPQKVEIKKRRKAVRGR